MLSHPPGVYRKRIAKPKATTTTPAAPVLVAAVFETEPDRVVLTFDRPVTVTTLVGEAVHVFDGNGYNFEFVAETATAIDPVTISLTLVVVSSWFDPGTTLSATNGTGIVSVNGAIPWAGVTGLALPFA